MTGGCAAGGAILYANGMAIILLAVLAFVVLRVAIPRLKFAGSLKVSMLAVPCAVAAWLLLSLITNVAVHAR